MKQRILVIGSQNAIGAQVLAALSASDWAAPLPYAGPPSGLKAGSFANIDAVFNATAGRPAAIIDTARTLYGALAGSGTPIRAVHLSSMTVYGSNCGEAVETSDLRADLGAYGAAQIAGESLARAYPYSVILRPGCEYGPQCPEWSVRIARLLRAHRLGDLGAAGDGVCNLLFVQDLIAAVSAALRLPHLEGEAFNLAMREPPTWNEYLVSFAKALGATPVSRINARRLKLEVKLFAPALKAFELMERRLRRGQFVPPPITPSLLKLCRQELTLNVTKAERGLSMRWTALQDGLRQTAAALGGY